MGFILGTEMRIMSRFLPTLRARCPEVQTSFHTLSEPELIEWLEMEKINVAFGPGSVANPNIITEVILTQRLVVVLPSAHPLARLRKVPLERLASMTWIRPSLRNSPRFVNSVEQLTERAGVHFNSFIEQDNILSAMHAVGLEMGFAFVPDYQREILPGSIVARSLAVEPQPTFDLSMAYRKNDHTPALPFFLSIVHECMSASIRADSAAEVHSPDPHLEPMQGV
jgi:LysR family hca operon transcriptional activator